MKRKGIGSDVAKTTKNIVKQAVKQGLQEPAEVLKTAGSQVAGSETVNQVSQETAQDQIQPETPQLDEEEMRRRGKRIVEALEEEIKEIKRQKEEEYQARVQAETEPQIEEKEKIKPLPEVSTKQARGDLKGIKGKIKKLKTKAEIRMPPSG